MKDEVVQFYCNLSKESVLIGDRAGWFALLHIGSENRGG